MMLSKPHKTTLHAAGVANGKNALVGDISQFYPTVNLIPKHWRYQRILLRENIDPNKQLLEAVIVKLAFSVSSVSS